MSSCEEAGARACMWRRMMRRVMSKETQARSTETRKYDLEERLLDFTCAAIEVVESLPGTRIGNHIAGQLVRCGTSPVANYAEAQGAESRKDFVHRMKVCLKELRETRVWLLMIQRRGLSSLPDIAAPTLNECVQLIAIFRSSVTTAEQNMAKGKTRR